MQPGDFLANEGDNFSVPRAAVVKYGADTRWIEKAVEAGEYPATNAFFGGDPAEFTFKKVYLVSIEEEETEEPLVAPTFSESLYKAIAGDFLGPLGVAYRFGAPACLGGVNTLPEKALEGYTQTGNSLPTWYSFGPPDYNDPNLYMTVQAITVCAVEAKDDLPDAVHWFQTASVGSETAAFMPQISWQGDGTTVPQELNSYDELLSNETRIVAATRGENTADAANTRISIVFTQGTDTEPAKAFTLGTTTANNRAYMEFPLGQQPTCGAVTNNGEFAFVPVWDTNDQTGKVAVIALGEGPNGCEWDGFQYDQGHTNPHRDDWWHTWTDRMHPGLAGQGNFCFMKIVGYVDLPFTAPTDCKVVTGVTSNVGAMYGANGITGYQKELSPLSDSDNRAALGVGGDQYEFYAKGGVLVVASRSERQVAFIDLGPLFAYINEQYYTTQTKYDATLNVGYGATEWPFVPAESLPIVVKTFTLDDDIAGVWVSPNLGYWSKDDRRREYEPDGPFIDTPHYPKAAAVTVHGNVHLYSLGRYAAGVKPTTPDPDDIAELGSLTGVGDNITWVAINKGHDLVEDAINNSLIFVDRANRAIGMVDFSNLGSVLTHTTLIQDSRIDPVCVAGVDDYHTDWRSISVADATGKCVRNYRHGTLRYGGNAPQWSPAACPTGGQYGGRIDLGFSPYIIHASNVP